MKTVKYEVLSKTYYKDPKAYEALYAARFNSEYAVHLDFDIKGSPAFFLQTPELLRSIIHIQRLDKQLSSLSSSLPRAALPQFFRSCLIDEIILTNNIEGVHSTRREIGELLDQLDQLSKGDRRQRFFGLVQKYVLLAQKQNIPLSTCEDVRQLYDELVLAEVRAADPQNVPDGRLFRRGMVSVKSAAQKELHRGLYPEAAISAAMEKALAILADDSWEPLARIAVFHYLFGYIHPFYDGNGRVSRFISSYLLAQELEPLVGYRLSSTVKERLGDYYAAFKICNDPKNRGDLTPFLLMFTELVQLSVQQLIEALKTCLEQMKHYAAQLPSWPGAERKAMSDLYNVLLSATFFSDYGLSTQQLLTMFDLSRTALAKRLQCIEQAGLLTVTKQGREKYYMLDLEAADQRQSVD